MGSRDLAPKTRCSQCGTTLTVPCYRNNVECPLCHHVTYVRQNPVRHAVGFVRAIVGNLSNPRVYVPPTYPRVFGKKRALLVGVTYTSQEKELHGPVNDVQCMARLLDEKFGFPRECMLILTEEEQDPSRLPTKENIRAAMRWLISGSSTGDSLVFHFSGHGGQEDDTDNDEIDGKDEGICPIDYQYDGMILDDEINATIVRPLPYGAKLIALIDACHSGTVLDLPYVCKISRKGKGDWEDHSAPSGEYKGTSGGLAILISACEDYDESEDTPEFTGEWTGAMTYSFIQAVESAPRPTYGHLLTAMKSIIRGKGSRFTGPIASLIRRTISFRHAQDPQLSSSETFEIYNKPFLL